MTTISTVEDFVAVLDANPEWLAVVRARILTEDVLELPTRLSQFIQATNERLAALEESQAEMRASQARMEAAMQMLLESHARMEERQNTLDEVVRRMSNDVGEIRGAYALRSVTDDIEQVVWQMGGVFDSLVSQRELIEIVDSTDTSDISRDDLRSFTTADIVARLEDSEGDGISLLAMEVSYTAQPDDIRRALRNAEYLTRFTGLPARAAVAGVQYSIYAANDIETGMVYWHEIPRRALRPR